MARRKYDGLAWLIVLIFALPIFFIVWVVKAINKAAEKSNQNSYSYNTGNSYNSSEDNLLLFSKTEEQLNLEAEQKFNKISDERKEKYLQKRKSFLLKVFLTLSIVSLCLSVGLFIGYFVSPLLQDEKISMLVFFIIFLITAIALFVYFIVNIKRSDEELIKKQIITDLKNTYKNLANELVSENFQLVKDNSLMYKNIIELNKQYNFDRKICKVHQYYEELNSKRQLDNFNYDKWILEHINNHPSFFSTFINIYEENTLKYKEYSKKYYSLRKYREVNEIEDLDIEYEVFNYIERKIFEDNKEEPIIAPQISLEISYTSPSGRNHYDDYKDYSYSSLVNYVKEKETQEELRLLELKKKEKLAEEKRAKEKKLRELDKLEKKLAEKEAEISQKEKEFLEATKGHIYSSDKKVVASTEIEDEENLTITQKMKILKTKFDNGEITYEEYQAKRKDLM